MQPYSRKKIAVANRRFQTGRVEGCKVLSAADRRCLGRHPAGLRLAVFGGMCLLGALGCRMEQRVELDMTAEPIRFIVNHRGWPAPFWYPRVTEFAIASDEDKLIWQVETSEGLAPAAAEFAIIYGGTPQGFQQVYPANNAAPDQLVPGRAYYVAAGSVDAWTGEYVYRMVFSLPVYRSREPGLPGTPHRRQGMPSPVTQPPSRTPPAAQPPPQSSPRMRPVAPSQGGPEASTP